MSEHTKNLPAPLTQSPREPQWVWELKSVLNRILDWAITAPFPRGDSVTINVGPDGTIHAIPDDMILFRVVRQYDSSAEAYQAKVRAGFATYDAATYEASWHSTEPYVEELSAALTLATSTANKVWIVINETSGDAEVLVSATTPDTETYPAAKHIATVTTDADDNITLIDQHWTGGNINFGAAEAEEPVSSTYKLKYWHETDSEVGLDHHNPDTWQDCMPSTAAGRYWRIAHIYTDADNTLDSGQDVPANEVWLCHEQVCLPITLVAGYCNFSTGDGEYISFIDSSGNAYEETVTAGVMGTFTGIIAGTHPTTGDDITATFSAGQCTDYEGQIIIANAQGDTHQLRIGADGKIKE
jgi:hypothetical protein